MLWLVPGFAAFLLTSRTRAQVSLWALLATVLTLLVVYVALISRGLEHPFVVVAGWFMALLVIAGCYRMRLGERLGYRLALATFFVLLGYWGGLALLHSAAMRSGAVQAAALAGQRQERIIRAAAMPTVANPFHWRYVFETDKASYRFEVDLTRHDTPAGLVGYSKPQPGEGRVVGQALKDRRSQIFMEFARFPVEEIAGDCLGQTLVQFADLRYTEPGKSRGNFALDVPVECSEQNFSNDGR